MKDVKKTKKRVRHYDEYDYEEAYQVQTKNLEEFEVERVLKEGKEKDWCGLRRWYNFPRKNR